MTIPQLYDIFLQHPCVTTDTRDCPEGSLFFALRGESFDGNQFALQALQKGCAFAVVDDANVAKQDERMILVDDVLKCLQELAAFHRRKLKTPILQITGTNGKTTTKELCAAVLARKYNLLYTQGNFNNHIGVPKTLLQLRPEHEMAVIETGANHPGEIALLTAIVQPDCGLITNVGRAHLEGFGSFEGVKRTKGELYDYLRTKPEGFIFLHADSADLVAMSEGLHAFTYGRIGQEYNIEGQVDESSAFLHLRWRSRESDWHEIDTHLVGAYNAPNALAAIAVGTYFRVPAREISDALRTYVPHNNRSELRHTEHNDLIVDAYNANPSSMAVALDNFQHLNHPHKVAILGEMRELGTSSAAEHQHIVERLPQLRCETVLLVGRNFSQALETINALRAEKGEAQNDLPLTLCFENVEAVTEYLEQHPMRDRLVLIKGSNGTKLFQLPEKL